jgi:hypothetical protein
MVTVYSVADRFPVVHCQGHDSWVSRVHWDPWQQLGGNGNGNGVGGVGGGSGWALGGGGGGDGDGNGQPGAGGDAPRLYRLASVGQDSQMCLWDVQMMPPEGDLLTTLPVALNPNSIRCVAPESRCRPDSCFLDG